MEISWTDRVRNEEMLHGAQEEWNIVHMAERIKANLIGHILRRDCVSEHTIEGWIDGGIGVTERQGRRGKQLLDDHKETRG